MCSWEDDHKTRPARRCTVRINTLRKGREKSKGVELRRDPTKACIHATEASGLRKVLRNSLEFKQGVGLPVFLSDQPGSSQEEGNMLLCFTGASSVEGW